MSTGTAILSACRKDDHCLGRTFLYTRHGVDFVFSEGKESLINPIVRANDQRHITGIVVTGFCRVSPGFIMLVETLFEK